MAAVVLLAVLWCGCAMADYRSDLIARQSGNEQMEVGKRTTFWIDVDGNDDDYYYQWHIGYAEVTALDRTVFHEAAQGYAAGMFFVPTDKDALGGWRNHAVFTDEHDSVFEITPTDDALSGTYLYCAVWSKEPGRDKNGQVSGVGDFAYSTLFPLTIPEDTPYLTAGNETGPVYLKVGQTRNVSVQTTKEYYYKWMIGDNQVDEYDWDLIESHAIIQGNRSRSISIAPSDTWLEGKQIYCVVTSGAGKLVYSPSRTIHVADSMIKIQPRYQITYPKGSFTYSLYAPAAVSYEWKIISQGNEYSMNEIVHLGLANMSGGGETVTIQPVTQEPYSSSWLASPAVIYCTVTDADGNHEDSEKVQISYPINYDEPEDRYDYPVITRGPDKLYSVQVEETFEASLEYGLYYPYGSPEIKCEWHIEGKINDTETVTYDWETVRQHAEVHGENTSHISIKPTDTWLDHKWLYGDVSNCIELMLDEKWCHSYTEKAAIRIQPGGINLEDQGAVTITSASGQNNAGELLTAELSGGVATMAGHLTYQWQSQAANGNWINMGDPERTGSTTCPFSYAGQTIRVRITADGMQGSMISNSIQLNQPAVNVSVYIPRKESGYTYWVGEEMSAVVTAEDGLILFYQWQRSTDGYDWYDIPDATTLSYTAVAADVGKLIRVQVSAAYHEGAVFSNDYVIDEPVYTVSFDMQGHGTQISPGRVQNGSKLNVPAEPEETGWVFGGWYTDYDMKSKFNFNTPVTENLTLHAWWGHTVSFSLNGRGKSWLTPGTQRVHEGGTARMPSVYSQEDDDGWYIRGWYEEPECTKEFDFTQPIAENRLLYAKWEYDGYEVTYHWNGNHNVTRCKPENGYSVNIDPDAPVTLRVRTGNPASSLIPMSYDRSGYYVIEGWYTEPACISPWDFSNPVTEDMSLYARWEHNNTLIAHDTYPDGSPGATFIYAIPYNTAPSQNSWALYHLTNHESHPGWVFAGWYTDEEYTQPFYPDAVMTEDTDIYRKWEPAVFTVTFDMDGGSGENIVLSCHYNDVISRPDTVPTKEDFVCRAWYCEELNVRMWATGNYVEWTCTGDATFKAVWIPDGIEIDDTFHYNFPDEAFRNYVKRFDTNDDGNLSPAEGDAVTSLDVAGYTYNGQKISSLQGIKYFPKLETLICPYQNLTSLDLSQNTELRKLECYGNQITALNLNSNTKLTTLRAQNNALTAVNAVKCTGLTGPVYLYSNPNLTSVQLSAPGITTLSLQFTGVTGIDLSGCPNLGLAISNGQVATAGSEPNTYERHWISLNNGDYSVYLSHGTPLDGFITSGLLIDEAHFPDPGFRAYVSEVFDRNHNGTLNDSEITLANGISTYGVQANQAQNLRGLEYLTNIQFVDASGMGLTELDVSQNPLITSINVNRNQLAELDVSALSNLASLQVNENPLLQRLVLGDNQLHYLSVCDAPYLSRFDLSRQPLLLKAYLDGEQTVDEDGNVTYNYSWNNGGQQGMHGTLILHSGVDVLLPEWTWNGITSAIFTLPDGTETSATIRRSISGDGRSAIYTATATVSGVPFTDSQSACLITFEDANVAYQELNEGDFVERPENPFMAGSIFDGWYLDPDYETPYTFADPVTEGFTVYAKWITPAVSDFLKLPAAMRTIESEAFYGTAAEAVIVPASVTSIAYDAFHHSGVRYIYGFPGSRAESFANTYGFTFIPINNAWLAAH